MHTRERGAVNMFVFLMVLVLMLGAAFFGYSQYDEAKRLTADRHTARTEVARMRLQVLVRDHLLEDIRKVIGEAGTYKGREAWDYGADIADAAKAGVTDAAIPELPNVTIPGQITTKVNEFGRDLKLASSLTNGLSDLLSQIGTAYKVRSQELADAKSSIAKLSGERSTFEATVAQVNKDRSTDSTSATQANTELRQFVDAEFARKQNLIDTMRKENQDRRTELSDLQEKQKGEQRAWAKEKSLLEARIAAQAAAAKLQNAPEATDGKLLSTSAATNLAYVDLGAKDMLPVGTVFKVADPRDGKLKAMGEVVQVERDRAQVRIFDVQDKFDFPVSGDVVSSPIYSPNVRRNVALLGRFGYPYSKDMVKAMFEKLGNKVHDNVGPGVDLIIVGDETLSEDGDSFVKVEDTDDYKRAMQLGVEFAPLHKVRSYLKQ